MQAFALRGSPSPFRIMLSGLFSAAARSYPFLLGDQESDSVDEDSVAVPTECCDSLLITSSSLG